MKKIELLHYINEIVSRETYKDKFFKKERRETKSRKYKDILRTVLKKFFTVKGSSFPRRNIIIPLKDTKKNNLMINDIKIINYLNRNGYSCTKESYNLGQCTNKNNVTEGIINVLTQIKSYDVNAEKKKLDNPKVPEIGKQQAQERINRFNNLDKSLVSYYERIVSRDKQMIVFTWVPRKIASQSTDVGWTSCQNLFDGSYNSFVFPGIAEGAFIAWLVKRGDEFKLDNPIARTVIKVYRDKYGNKIWWPDAVYGTASPLFLERVKDYLREKQVDSVLLSTSSLISTQYDDGSPNIVWDAWTDENIKSKHVIDKYREIFKQQKQTKDEMTKTILSKIKNESIKENEIESIFRHACKNNYHELAFRLYKRYNFLPDESILEDSIGGDGIFYFLIKDKRVKKVSSGLMKTIIKKGDVGAFDAVLKYKKIEIKDGAEYVKLAHTMPHIITVMLKYDDIFTIDFETCRLMILNFGFDTDQANDNISKSKSAMHVYKTVLRKTKTFTNDEKNKLFDAAVRGRNAEAAKFLTEELKFKFSIADNDKYSYFMYAIGYNYVPGLLDCVIDNVQISKEEKIKQTIKIITENNTTRIRLIKHIIDNKKIINADDIASETVVKALKKLDNDNEMRLYLLAKSKKLADMFNAYEVKYIPPRNLDNFDYTAVFYRFNPKNILEERKIKKSAIKDGWIETYSDSTDHNDYEENDISEIIKGILLSKRKLYNNVADKNRQISDDLIYKLIGNKDLTKKEKVDIVNFLYFMKDNKLMVERDEDDVLYNVFDFVAYTKAFNIRRQAEINANMAIPKPIYNTKENEEDKLEIPKRINAKDYISAKYYKEIDEDQEENIKVSIEDLYRVAIEKLQLNDINIITRAIKDMYGDNYLENKISIDIFKKAIENEDDVGVLAVNMPLFDKYKEILKTEKKENKNNFNKYIDKVTKEKNETKIKTQDIIDIIKPYAKEYNSNASRLHDERELNSRKEAREIFQKEYPEIYEKIQHTREFSTIPEEKWYIGNTVYSLMRDENVKDVENEITKYRKLTSKINEKWYEKIKYDWVGTEGILRIINGNLNDSHYIDDLIRLMEVMNKDDREQVKQYIKQEKLFTDSRLDNL